MYYANPFQLGNSTLPKPRVVWIGRDSSLARNPTEWQQRRIISNQDELTQYLETNCREQGIEMYIANFYDEQGSQTSYREQAHFVSRANILIGVHGAGLNLAMFMPFNSVVVEIHLGTRVQANSKNTIAHLGGGSYISFDGNRDRNTKRLDQEQVWQFLQQAIRQWEEIHARPYSG